MNLLSNAIKFTEKGKVIFKTEVLDKKSNTVQIQFSVKDTGIGISKENQLKIFEKFEQIEEHSTSQHGGTGLGLSIVKKLAELKGGHLHLESVEGKGSKFCFTKWYEYREQKQQQEVKPEIKLLPLKGLSVLVAEDNLINTFLIKKILEGWEVDLKLVVNGIEVLEILQENDFDVILMDTYMPKMNGLDVTRKIRSGAIKGKENTPIITFTAGILESEKETSLKAGANDILSKPFNINVLYDKLKAYHKA
jgi:CheY-like chemotaxis protein